MKRICCSVLALLTFLFLPAVAQEHAADTPHAPATSVVEAQSAERIWAELLAGNKRFVAGKTKVREYGPLRSKLAGGQHPKVIVLACSVVACLPSCSLIRLWETSLQCGRPETWRMRLGWAALNTRWSI